MSERLSDVVHPTCMSVKRLGNHTASGCIPTNFFWCKGVRFSSGIVELLRLYKKNAQILPKIYKDNPENFQRCSKHFWTLVPWYPLPNTTSSLLKIGEYSAEELPFTGTFQSSIALSTNYMFTYYILSRHSSDMAAGNNSYFPVRHEIEVFDPPAWDSHPTRDSWQVYCCSNNFATNEI